jgi:hypothetical protein
MVDPFSPETLLSFPLDEAGELRETRLDQARLDYLNRLASLCLHPEARRHAQLALFLGLETNVTVDKAVDLMRRLPDEPGVPEPCRVVCDALEHSLEEAAELIHLRVYERSAA